MNHQNKKKKFTNEKKKMSNSTMLTACAREPVYKGLLFSFGILTSLSIFVLNLAIFVRILTSERLRVLKNLIILNLCVSDFLSGIAFLVPSIMHLAVTYPELKNNNPNTKDEIDIILSKYNNDLVLVIYIPLVTSMLASMLSLTSVAILKYFRIMRPFFYLRLVNELRCLTMTCLFTIWIVALFVCILPLFVFGDVHVCRLNANFKPSKCNKHLRIFACMFHRIFRYDLVILFTFICSLCSMVIFFIYLRLFLCAQNELNKLSRMKLCRLSNRSSRKRKTDSVKEHEPLQNIVESRNKMFLFLI
jgi:hypothetical protein